jgi:Ca-activated chloride channel family protein
VSIVTYNGAAQTLIRSIGLTPAQRDLIARTLDGIRASGNTCISCGIEEGLVALERRSDAVRRMLLLSDGEANRGVTDMPRLRELAARARAREVAISSIGVDLEYNERLLSELARMSNGMHHFVEDSRQLSQAFDAELETLTATIADQARVELTLADGVRMLEVADREFSVESGVVEVPLGSFSPGETKTVLMRVELPARSVGDHPVADVRLGFFDRVVGGPSVLEGALLARAIAGDVSSAVDPIVEARVERTATIETIREANDSLGDDQPDAALEIIRRARVQLKKRSKKARAAPAAAADIEGQLTELDKAWDNISRNQASPRDRKRALKLNQAALNPMAL